MYKDADDQVKTPQEHVQICAHCGAENPPGLLLCLVCGREPVTGRDLFASPDIPTPAEPPVPELISLSADLVVTLPDPIQVPDPLPIPTLEEFIAPPEQPHPAPPPVYRAPPAQPRDMAPLLSPLPRWATGLLGLVILTFLGLGIYGSVVTLNLPNSICLGTLWLAIAVAWLGMMLARRGESRSRVTGARRRVVNALGQRVFEVTPQAAREQRARLPVRHIPPFVQPASQLIYLSSRGDRTGQLTQVLLGTLCAMVAGDHIELVTQTYDVLTASPLRRHLETIKRTAVSRRALYVGAGYLEKLIFERLRQSPTVSARDLTYDILHQAGADLLDRIAVGVTGVPTSQEAVPDLDAQVVALREFCDELKALNPDLHAQLAQEVEEAVQAFIRAARQRSR